MKVVLWDKFVTDKCERCANERAIVVAKSLLSFHRAPVSAYYLTRHITMFVSMSLLHRERRINNELPSPCVQRR
ncbi:hypothetical protein ACP4OV_000514 [Aristida adscensionis]